MENLKTSKPISLNQVKLKDSFWSRYGKLVKEEIIPYQWAALNDNVEDAEPSHAVKNFKIAAGLEEGEFYGMVFQDSDLAKWLEAVGFSLQTNPDKELEALADGVIDVIEKAQQADGYLDTYFILKEPDKKWTNLYECHELYCAGHMIEAAVAYYNATGKKKILDVVCRLADHIDSIFGSEEGKMKGYPGHEEIELSLVKLYHVTGESRYLNLAKYFIDERGKEPYYFEVEWEKRGRTYHWNPGNRHKPAHMEYNQAHLPVRDQNEAIGHAVRAVYLYTGMADIAAETGDKTLLEACERLWNNMVNKQMYITGGIGSTNHGEAFTFDFDLPNDTVYQETCASIGLMFFAHRMLQIEAKGTYADAMERALYNSVISGMALDGKRFFYVNPMEVLPEASEKNPSRHHVKPVRQKWYGCACCPPNVARLLASLGEYIYTVNDKAVYTHLYIGGEAECTVAGEKVKLTQETNYPWDGKVNIKLSLENNKEFVLALRIPGWCRNAKVKVNNQEINIKSNIVKGYALLNRVWENGDEIDLELEMSVEIIQANPKVRADAGKVAIQRGPVVYCLEESDNGKNLSAISLLQNSNFTAEYKENLLGGVVIVKGEAVRTKEEDWNDELYRPYKNQTETTEITAVPYAFWGNRQEGEMQVWIRHE